MNKNYMENNTGKIVQIIGPVVDVYFEGAVPALRNALKTRVGDREITLEVAQHVGLGRARAIALMDTAGRSLCRWESSRSGDSSMW